MEAEAVLPHAKKLQMRTSTNLYSNLYIIGWIPVNIKKNKPRSSNQVQSHSTSFRTQQKYNCKTKGKVDMSTLIRSMYYRAAFLLKSLETVSTEAFFNSTFVRPLVRIWTRRLSFLPPFCQRSRRNTRLILDIHLFMHIRCFTQSSRFNDLTRVVYTERW